MSASAPGSISSPGQAAPPAAPAVKLDTPDHTRVQTVAVVQFIVVAAGALGFQLTDEDRTTLAGVVAAAGAAFSAVLVSVDAAIRRGRARWVASAQVVPAAETPTKALTAAAAAAGWNTAIPATGWFAVYERDRRPVAAWALVSQPDGDGARLAGLVKKGRGFGVAEDIDDFKGYEYEGQEPPTVGI